MTHTSIYAYQNASKKVGLLGGSFDPAHEGHIHISEMAMRRLGLDQVWWLVSPQNPLKKTSPHPLEDRLAYAEYIAKGHPSILVSNIESELGTTYSIEIIEHLRKLFRSTRFVWIMGADNLISMNRWYRWEKLMRSLPIAVFDRVPYTSPALSSPAAQKFQKFRQREEASFVLKNEKAPAWVYLPIRPHPESSTNIRESYAKGGK